MKLTLTCGVLFLWTATAFVPSRPQRFPRVVSFVNADEQDLPEFDLPEEEEAERLKSQAQELREQIRNMEKQLDGARQQKRQQQQVPEPAPAEDLEGPPTLRGKRILVAGANGRLGSMVCRHLLRTHPEVGEVVGCVHLVSENSSTSRGYARLSYEVGAEDGVGSIGPAWSSTDRTAIFEFDQQVMGSYNLNKLRIVECEYLDPVQCTTVCEGVDAVIWCATDFDGNAPRSVVSLDFGLLFRAVANPTKGRVEIEGLENMLGALKLSKKASAPNDPINFVHISMVPEAYANFETPFGEFNAMKRQGEDMVLQNFPSLSQTVLQMGLYDDLLVEEGQDVSVAIDEPYSSTGERRLINRRDAARAAVESLLKEDLKGTIAQVYTVKK